ncbi:MAG: GNAT family N-acetyltransferase [Candidatus Scalindua sp.]
MDFTKNKDFIEVSDKDLKIDGTFTMTANLPFTGTRPFMAGDMAIIMEDGIKEQGIKYYGAESLEELAQQTEDDGLSMTGIVNDIIVGCGGIRKLWPNVGEVWMLLSPKVNLYPIRTYECIRDGFQKLIDENDFVRLQGWCRVDFVKAHTLYRHLGFKVEGRARKFTPDGCDCLLYSLIKD